MAPSVIHVIWGCIAGVIYFPEVNAQGVQMLHDATFEAQGFGFHLQVVSELWDWEYVVVDSFWVGDNISVIATVLCRSYGFTGDGDTYTISGFEGTAVFHPACNGDEEHIEACVLWPNHLHLIGSSKHHVGVQCMNRTLTTPFPMPNMLGVLAIQDPAFWFMIGTIIFGVFFVSCVAICVYCRCCNGSRAHSYNVEQNGGADNLDTSPYPKTETITMSEFGSNDRG